MSFLNKVELLELAAPSHQHQSLHQSINDKNLYPILARKSAIELDQSSTPIKASMTKTSIQFWLENQLQNWTNSSQKISYRIGTVINTNHSINDKNLDPILARKSATEFPHPNASYRNMITTSYTHPNAKPATFFCKFPEHMLHLD
ncbi:unnamed protein product [Ilex paraguariensis]|uniref:Uncharacterized protein n=1 Tax=Ilex paraguariensis TaxID=185542 RepID=A0ABC8TE80_9AQUA